MQEALLSVIFELLKKMQFRYNSRQLLELDTTALDDNRKGGQISCIVPLENVAGGKVAENSNKGKDDMLQEYFRIFAANSETEWQQFLVSAVETIMNVFVVEEQFQRVYIRILFLADLEFFLDTNPELVVPDPDPARIKEQINEHFV